MRSKPPTPPVPWHWKQLEASSRPAVLGACFVACTLLTYGPLKVTKQDLLPKAKDEAALARRP